MRLRRLNRKGEDMLVDFWAILIFALILFIIFILFYFSRDRGEQRTIDDFKDKDASFMLHSFLRSPYLKDRQKTMAEVIAEDTLAKDFTRTENSFYYYFSGFDTYSVTFDGDYTIPREIDSITLCIDSPNFHMQQYFTRERSMPIIGKNAEYLDKTSSGNNWLDGQCNNITSDANYIAAVSDAKLPGYAGEMDVRLIVKAYKSEYEKKKK